jgi:hypothetical protein
VDGNGYNILCPKLAAVRQKLRIVCQDGWSPTWIQTWNLPNLIQTRCYCANLLVENINMVTVNFSRFVTPTGTEKLHSVANIFVEITKQHNLFTFSRGSVEQWYSTGGTRRHLRAYVKLYIYIYIYIYIYNFVIHTE